MILTKVIVNTTSAGADLVSNILIKNGSNGTTIVDKKDVLDFMRENPKLKYSNTITEFYPSQALVVGVIDPATKTETLKKIKKDLTTLAKNSPFVLGELSVRCEDVNDEHYKDIWNDYYKPFVVGKLKIYAKWQKVKNAFFKIPIILNPGPAFGTGQHPTTEACLALLQTLNLHGKTVLDIGTGTGILGIASIKLGAKSATLTDIDEVAIDSAKLNAETNNCLDKVNILKQDIVGDSNFVADVALVNIDSKCAINFANGLKQNLTQHGDVIISGVLKTDLDEVSKTYERNGYKIIKQLQKEDWVAFIAQKD